MVIDRLALGIIEPPQLRLVWNEVAPLLESACAWSYGAYTPESVVNALVDHADDFKLLALADDHIRDIMFIAFGKFPSGLKVLECILTSGEDMKLWLPYEADLDDYARSEGCQRVRAIGRKGLAKKLPHWKMIGVMLERTLVDGQ